MRIGPNTYAAFFVDGDTITPTYAGDIITDLPSFPVTFAEGGTIMTLNGVAIATLDPSKIINKVSASAIGMNSLYSF